MRLSDSSGILGSASSIPLRPRWSNDAMQPTKSWLHPLCSLLLDPPEILGSVSGIPLQPEWSNDAMQPTSSWWQFLLAIRGAWLRGILSGWEEDHSIPLNSNVLGGRRCRRGKDLVGPSKSLGMLYLPSLGPKRLGRIGGGGWWAFIIGGDPGGDGCGDGAIVSPKNNKAVVVGGGRIGGGSVGRADRWTMGSCCPWGLRGLVGKQSFSLKPRPGKSSQGGRFVLLAYFGDVGQEFIVLRLRDGMLQRDWLCCCSQQSIHHRCASKHT